MACGPREKKLFLLVTRGRGDEDEDVEAEKMR